MPRVEYFPLCGHPAGPIAARKVRKDHVEPVCTNHCPRGIWRRLSRVRHRQRWRFDWSGREHGRRGSARRDRGRGAGAEKSDKRRPQTSELQQLTHVPASMPKIVGRVDDSLRSHITVLFRDRGQRSRVTTGPLFPSTSRWLRGPVRPSAGCGCRGCAWSHVSTLGGQRSRLVSACPSGRSTTSSPQPRGHHDRRVGLPGMSSACRDTFSCAAGSTRFVREDRQRQNSTRPASTLGRTCSKSCSILVPGEIRCRQKDVLDQYLAQTSASPTLSASQPNEFKYLAHFLRQVPTVVPTD